MLLLLNCFGVTVNFVTVINFNSQYMLFLLNRCDVTVNFVTVQFSIHTLIAKLILC